MIIDAMDILYSGNCDGFVLVSSDSDFTRLATRLREAGMKVYGMGEKKRPSLSSWPATNFVYIEVIRAAAQQAALAGEGIRSPEELQEEQQEGGPSRRFPLLPPARCPQDMVELIADSRRELV